MSEIDCEKLKQIRDDAYTQLVLVQIEAKDQSARKGFLGFFNKPKSPEDSKDVTLSPEQQEIQARLETAKIKYEEAKKITSRIARVSYPVRLDKVGSPYIPVYR